jgi:lysozyme
MAAIRPIPEAAREIVREFEGLRLEAYVCPAGVLTIGYGHTGPEVTQGLKITKRQAEIYLTQDLQAASRRLASRIGPVVDDLTDNQYAALLSFVFNLGANPSWTLWKVLKAKDFDAVPAQLSRFVYAGKTKLKGLVRRRNAEVALWSEEEPGSADEAVNSAHLRHAETPPAPLPEKPLVQSKTIWTGGIVAAGGAVEAARNVQAIAAPQAANNELIAKLAGLAAFVIVAGGIAIMVFRYLDSRKRRQ